jgi:hypothetical protein
MPANSWCKPLHCPRLLLALLIAPLLSLPAFAQTQPPIFPTNILYTATNILGPFTSGDFNGDGQPDVAYISPPAEGTAYPSIVVLLNQGTIGAFTPVTTGGLSCTANTIEAADLNNDKNLDLALTCKEGYVVVLLGNGNGTFQSPSYVSVPNAGLLAPPVDLNGDGYLDLVSTSATATSTNISVLLNQGTSSPGTFSTVKTYPGPTGISFSTIGVGDFNGDGKQDVLAGPVSAPFVVFYGNGDGTLQTLQTLQATSNINGAFATGDFNRDGFTDIAYLASTASTSSLQVLLGNSSGQFTTGSSLPLNAGAAYQTIVPAGSTNNGNNTDLALIGNNFLIALGDGNGGFTSGQTYDFSGILRSVSPEAAGNGKTNLIFNTTSGLVFVPGNGDGTFQALPTTDLENFILVSADLNNDGLTDVLGIDTSGNLVAALGRGNGRFTITSRIPGPGVNGQMAAGDFNGDGNIDDVLFLVNGAGVQVTFLAGNGDGTFQPAAAGIQMPVPGVQTTVTGDFNGDKNLDIVFFSSGTRAQPQASYLYYLAGNGQGAFAAPVAIAQQDLNDSGSLILTADLNRDNKMDLIWNNTVFLGNGDGTFNRQPLSVSGTPLAVGDLNGDGIPDLVAKASGSGPVSIYAGNGDGTFQTSPFYTAILPPYISPASALIGDVNADGHPDLLVQYATAEDTTQLAVFLGNGAGNFTADSNVYFSGNTLVGSNVAFARLNNQAPPLSSDNTPDYLFGNAGGVTSLLNQLNPAPTTPALLPSKTALTVSANSAAPTQQLTFTATVTGATPTGTVSFVSGSTKLGSAPLTNGTASLFYSFATAGSYSVTATYSGDTNNTPGSSSAVSVTVAPIATQTSLAVSAGNAGTNQQLSFTATITGFSPAGNVTFNSGSTTLGTAIVTNGTASLPYAFTAPGTYTVTATYAGNIANLASTSTPVTVTIAAPDYTVTASPSTATIAAGQSATTTLTLTPVGGYNGTVKLSCGTLPAGATCTFAPASLTPASGAAATSTLTITTTAPTTAMLRRVTSGMQGIAMAGILCLTFVPWRTRKLNHSLLRTTLLTILLIAGLVSLSGCSSSPNSSGTTNPGTPTGTQTITVTTADASGALSHTINFQLTVN